MQMHFVEVQSVRKCALYTLDKYPKESKQWLDRKYRGHWGSRSFAGFMGFNW